jgi:hypothetical protein
MPITTNTPSQAVSQLTTVVSPGGSLGANANDPITFFLGGNQVASVMVANQYYTIASVGGVNFGSYGTLQAAPIGTGVANTVGAVYLASGPATLVAGPTGASASFANNPAGIGVMTLTVAPTGGTAFALGQVVTGTSLPATGLQIVQLLSGTFGAASSTYLMSAATGTVGAAAVTIYQNAEVIPSAIAQNSIILQNPAFAPLPATAYSGLTSTTPYGFSSLANAQALVAQVQAINAALLAVGLLDA